MIAIELELLSGRYIATAYNDREAAEWPPHPARLFSALVDAWAAGEPTSGEGEGERMALVWLERQEAPRIAASASDEIARRTVVPVFVPVNDTSVIREPSATREKLAAAEETLALRGTPAASDKALAKATKDRAALQKKLAADTAKATAAPAKISKADLEAAEELFPDRRGKQARTFPSVTPAEPRVTFVWAGEPEAALREALARLLTRLTRLGHSSSLVAARLVAACEAPRFAPSPDGELLLRGVAPGQMDRLLSAHRLHQGVESRVLPCTFVRYLEGVGSGSTETPRSVFDDEWIVLARQEGPRLPSLSTVGVAHQLRRALLAGGGEPMSEAISGHAADGAAATKPHLAVVPLPDVGGPYSHGGILGVALVLPREMTSEERAQILRAIGELERRARTEEDGAAEGGGDDPEFRLLLGAAGELRLARVVWGEHRTEGLRASTWCRASRRWATATPIALDRNPGDLHDADAGKRAKAFDVATELVAEAVTRIGLPAPAEIDVLRSCVLPGTEKPQRFPRFPISQERPQRVLVHARLRFEEAVRGPMLLGAGRYLGLGLCRPVDQGFRGRRRA